MSTILQEGDRLLLVVSGVPESHEGVPTEAQCLRLGHWRHQEEPLTVFSGTNDTLHLLSLTVHHLDFPSKSHTNALLLRYLLQEENSVELLPQRAKGTDAEHILSVIVDMEPEVRVLLDSGALTLEQNNRQVAGTRLKMRDQAIQAVVCFDDEERSVLDRTGCVESLQTSPFVKQLDSCMVYLDEAHTRGTDLGLPRKYRADLFAGSLYLRSFRECSGICDFLDSYNLNLRKAKK